MKRRAARCPACLIPQAFCICQVAAPEELATRVTVVVHYADIDRTTNTGKWAPVALTNSEVLIRGRRESPLDMSRAIQPDCHNLLLFPSKDSQQLSPDYVAALTKPVNLIVPDGNWNQAGKMVKREAQMAALPHVHLKIDKPTRYRLRTAAHQHWISTFEAISRALGVLENPALQARLEYFFDVAVERVLYLKGQIERDEVTGGISQEMVHQYHMDNGDQPYIQAHKPQDPDSAR
ncbi:MAG: tRNA-uridine aminocarboxypropyltransferase [Candidatus Krumholzibacteria bacterium]|nr:tRNA-uridine aminocarboxypropyltransferase [Candidatus Krumholzibacteria bacterium]